ncbi:hypothetical protein R69619_03326 [Paraburkholderia nemoris]|uniref:VapE domain-containing protein n=1 Tax=Paraburkholderia nemoris TaxID=2793076 RepID=UPI00190AB3FC|nr:VapE domain-containing protein [Paraburkholderia nemoris]MBK3743344.1 hypothetical protein [Paraburkholderia aspalathi]CAE6759933.1 hypothetical protein R69619_03326 [Paraburkholderia nemoris]
MAKKMVRPSEAEVDSHTLDMFELEAQGFAEQAVEVADAQKVERVAKYVEREERIAEASKIVDLAERGAELIDEIQFADIKKVRMGDMFIAVPEPTDTNKRIVLDYLFKGTDARPHFDTFRGRLIGYDDVVMDDFYSGTALLNAFNNIGLRKLKLNEVIDAARAYALDHRWNDLSKRVERMTGEWDGVPRMESALIRMFDSHDSRENRMFGTYFWLSLYVRMMHPGELAPIVLTLCGAQDCGKSFFGKLLARLITGNVQADSIQYNLDSDRVTFLRDITGQSVICSLGELAGASRAELNKTKDFLTRGHDSFSFKFEGSVLQARQWVCIADTNSYSGVYRDATGNRRLFVLHCFPGEEVEGQVTHRQGVKADFTELSNGGLWELFGEARAWLANNGGLDGYRDMVREVSKMVLEFSHNEVQNGRGTIADDSVAPHIVAALKNAPCREIGARNGRGKAYVFYDRSDLIIAIQQSAAPLDPTREKRFLTDLAKACAMKGNGIPARRDCKTIPGFAFYDHPTKADLLAAIGANGDRDEAKLIAGTPQQPTGF